MHPALLIALMGVLAIASVSDYTSRRIPNVLTAGAFVVALALRALVGADVLLDGLAGACLALLIALPVFARRGIGGGDAKLLIAVGAFVGPSVLVPVLLATALVGGVMSLGAAALRGTLLPVLFNTRDLLGNVLTLGRRGARTSLDTPGAVSVPYGVAIALGTVIALIWNGGLVP